MMKKKRQKLLNLLIQKPYMDSESVNRKEERERE